MFALEFKADLREHFEALVTLGTHSPVCVAYCLFHRSSQANGLEQPCVLAGSPGPNCPGVAQLVLCFPPSGPGLESAEAREGRVGLLVESQFSKGYWTGVLGWQWLLLALSCSPSKPCGKNLELTSSVLARKTPADHTEATATSGSAVEVTTHCPCLILQSLTVLPTRKARGLHRYV